MKIALAQIKPFKGQVSKNIDLHKKWIREAIDLKADCILFPELSLTGYEPALANELSRKPGDPIFDCFQEWSDQYNITIMLGHPVTYPNGIQIGQLIFQPHQKRTIYAKNKLHVDEIHYFVPAKNQLVLSIENELLAPAICYEALQPEHLEEAVALKATIYIASVAKPQKGIESAFSYFPKVAQQHKMPILMSNCIGFCDNFESAGQSAVWDSEGRLLGKLNKDEEGLLVFDTELRK